MKSREAIEYAAAKGVEWFVVDSVDEMRRIHEVKPDAKLYLRIDAPNIGSDWPLSGKFGAGVADAREIIAAAAQARRRPRGRDLPRRLAVPQPGELARRHRAGAQDLFDVMRKAGLKPRLLNIGGGFPVRHVKPIPSIEMIGEVVNEALRRSRRRAGDRRAGPLPRLRRRLLRLPRGRHRHARRQALDVLGRGPLRRRDRDDRGPALQHPHRPLRPGHRVDGRRPDLRLGGRRDARRAAARGPAGRRLHLHPERRRLHHRLREQLQRLSAARSAGLRVKR